MYSPLALLMYLPAPFPRLFIAAVSTTVVLLVLLSRGPMIFAVSFLSSKAIVALTQGTSLKEWFPAEAAAAAAAAFRVESV